MITMTYNLTDLIFDDNFYIGLSQLIRTHRFDDLNTLV